MSYPQHDPDNQGTWGQFLLLIVGMLAVMGLTQWLIS